MADNKASAPLAQPEPEGPADEALDKVLFQAVNAYMESRSPFGGPVDQRRLDRAKARAALARWGRPAIQPIPVAERLPEPEDCASEGTKHVGCCWQWLPGDGLGHWALAYRGWADADDTTHWLPYHALPIPQPTQPPIAP